MTALRASVVDDESTHRTSPLRRRSAAAEISDATSGAIRGSAAFGLAHFADANLSSRFGIAYPAHRARARR